MVVQARHEFIQWHFEISFNSVVLNVFWPVGIFSKKYPMDNFAMLTPHEQESKLCYKWVVLRDLVYSKGYSFQEILTKDLWNPL